MLWALPYLFLGTFGGALHTHNPFAGSSHTQSTLCAAATTLSATNGEDCVSSEHLQRDAHFASECLVCLWAAHSIAQTADVAPALAEHSARVCDAEVPSPHLFSLAIAQRNRGPPSL